MAIQLHARNVVGPVPSPRKPMQNDFRTRKTPGLQLHRKSNGIPRFTQSCNCMLKCIPPNVGQVQLHNKSSHPNSPLFEEKASAENPRGIFPTESWVKFAGDFLVDFLGVFLRKKQEEKSTKKSTAKFKSEFGSFKAKIHIARIWP